MDLKKHTVNTVLFLKIVNEKKFSKNLGHDIALHHSFGGGKTYPIRYPKNRGSFRFQHPAHHHGKDQPPN
jgi:hypothetical protein